VKATIYYRYNRNVCSNQSTNLFKVAKQLAAVGQESYDNPGLNSLKEAMGVMQHHDAITGTELMDVAHDYHRLLYKSLSSANDAVDLILS
jgi:lysosomal alpha-mannosidase